MLNATSGAQAQWLDPAGVGTEGVVKIEYAKPTMAVEERKITDAARFTTPTFPSEA